MTLTELSPRPLDLLEAARSRRRARAVDSRIRALPLPPRTPAHDEAPEAGAWTPAQLRGLWDRHGSSVYALACALLVDEAAAARAVTLAMADLALSTDPQRPDEFLPTVARSVYRHSQEARTPLPADIPPAMASLTQLAERQRASLALCVFGGLSHRKTAELLGVPASEVAELLTTGLRELKPAAADVAVTPA